MATSLVSALTRIPVSKDVAMTGEITLRGRVLPIGGLKDKVLAAHRGGIKTVILPEENKKDIRDIPKVVRNSVTLVVVNHMDQVIPIALSKDLAVEGDENTPDPLLELLIAKDDGETGKGENGKSEAPAVH